MLDLAARQAHRRAADARLADIEGRAAADAAAQHHEAYLGPAYRQGFRQSGAERGRGSFVNPQPPRLSYPITARTRFSENLAGQARAPAGRLIRSEIVAADAALARLLECRPGAPLHRLETLHVADGVPLSLATCHFSAERFPGIVAAYAETGSIPEALRREGCSDYRRRETRVSSDRVSPADALHLGLAADGIVLVTTSLDEDLAGKPVQSLQTRFPAERVELVIRSSEGG